MNVSVSKPAGRLWSESNGTQVDRWDISSIMGNCVFSLKRYRPSASATLASAVSALKLCINTLQKHSLTLPGSGLFGTNSGQEFYYNNVVIKRYECKAEA